MQQASRVKDVAKSFPRDGRSTWTITFLQRPSPVAHRNTTPTTVNLLHMHKHTWIYIPAQLGDIKSYWQLYILNQSHIVSCFITWFNYGKLVKQWFIQLIWTQQYFCNNTILLVSLKYILNTIFLPQSSWKHFFIQATFNMRLAAGAELNISICSTQQISPCQETCTA